MSNIKIGQRICIVGLSSAGKSTLAQLIGEKRNLPVLHLDQIFHLKNTQWQKRDFDDFKRDLSLFIEQKKWVIDGSYAKTLDMRLMRADTVIVLRLNRFLCLYRFFRRMISRQHKRVGMLEGARERISYHMIHYILFDGAKRYRKFDEIISKYTHLNVFYLCSVHEIDEFVKNL